MNIECGAHDEWHGRATEHELEGQYPMPHPNDAARLACRFIVIGTSSGGLAALRAVVAQLPANLPAAVLVTMHIGKQHSLLPTLLEAHTTMQVSFAEDGKAPLEGHIYIAPPDLHLLLDGVAMRLVRGAKENHSRPAIDPLFRSAAITLRRAVIGVVLTGDLDDGTVGLQAIKASGGVTVVQDPADAEAPSMPSSALRYASVDHCLPLAEIGKCLNGLVRKPDEAGTAPLKPRRIEPYETEHEICLRGGSVSVKQLGKHGQTSNLTCPECGGGLWEMGFAPPRFRCHTGHSYTVKTLALQQDVVIEEALWVAIRSLHEKKALLDRQVAAAELSDRPEVASEYELAGKQLDSHVEALMRLIGSLDNEIDKYRRVEDSSEV
jgi:two-component system chemotaxis response regulator CheB